MFLTSSHDDCKRVPTPLLSRDETKSLLELDLVVQFDAVGAD